MSDLLLIGRAPKTSEGEEYFLHCMDWWWDIYHVVETLLSDSFPVEELFYRDLWLGPPTPHLLKAEARTLSALLREKVYTREVEKCLREWYFKDPNVEDDGDVIDGWLQHRNEQIMIFIRFLDTCGGCKAKWYGVDEAGDAE